MKWETVIILQQPNMDFNLGYYLSNEGGSGDIFKIMIEIEAHPIES